MEVKNRFISGRVVHIGAFCVKMPQEHSKYFSCFSEDALQVDGGVIGCYILCLWMLKSKISGINLEFCFCSLCDWVDWKCIQIPQRGNGHWATNVLRTEMNKLLRKWVKRSHCWGSGWRSTKSCRADKLLDSKWEQPTVEPLIVTREPLEEEERKGGTRRALLSRGTRSNGWRVRGGNKLTCDLWGDPVKTISSKGLPMCQKRNCPSLMRLHCQPWRWYTV